MKDLATIDTIIGAIIAIFASIFNAVGYTIQKKGHNKLKEFNKNQDSKHKKKMCKEPVWALGFGIYLIGGILNAVALFYAPQSLVLPLSAVTLVVNTILATKILNEPFFKVDILGIILVISGSALAVIFGPRTVGGQTSMHVLEKRWADQDFLIFYIVLTSIICIDFGGIIYYQRINKTDEIQFGTTFLLLSYCLLAGYFGANAFLFLKSFTEFIGSSASSKTIAHENLIDWYSYVTLIFVVISNFLMEYFRQRGLKYFHAVYVVPINQVVLIVLGTILGGIYFQEFDSLTTVHEILFILAILLTVFGVIILAFNSGNITEKTDQNIIETIIINKDNGQPKGRMSISRQNGSLIPEYPHTQIILPSIPNIDFFSKDESEQEMDHYVELQDLDELPDLNNKLNLHNISEEIYKL